MAADLRNLLEEQNFIHHFIELEEMVNLLQNISTKEKIHERICQWKDATDIDGEHDIIHNFPSVGDISIVEDDTGIWVEKNLFMNKMRKIAIQVF